MLSEGQYERLRGVAWDRLASAMDAMAKEAEAKGLTDAKLAKLLLDESFHSGAGPRTCREQRS